MSESWQVDGHRVIEVGSADQPVRRVTVAVMGGRVDVVAHDDPEGRLEVHSVSGRPLEVSWDGATLEVRHPQAHWDSLLGRLAERAFGAAKDDESADLSLAVPRGAAVRIGTVSAEGLAVALSGPVEVRTVSGTLVLDHLSGPVVAHSVSGAIEARGQTGDLRMHSVSGSFTVQSDGAASLAAKTVSGSLHVDAASLPVTLGFNSVSGGLVLRQPGGSGYDADLHTVSGRVVVGTEEVRGYGAVSHRRRDPGAQVTVKANTVSGDITLLPASAAMAPA